MNLREIVDENCTPLQQASLSLLPQFASTESRLADLEAKHMDLCVSVEHKLGDFEAKHKFAAVVRSNSDFSLSGFFFLMFSNMLNQN